MPNNAIIHVIPLAEELERIADSLLKTALTPNLQSVNIGDLVSIPAPGILSMCPGIWLRPHPATTNDFLNLPKDMIQKYYYRLVYVRLIQPNENIVKKAMSDMTLIINTFTDKMMLPDITNLPSGTNVLWTIFKSVEWVCPEDDFVMKIHADLTAVAANLEVNVKTSRFQ